MEWEMQEYKAAVGRLFLGLSTKMLKRSTLKVCLCIVDGLLERRSELVGLVASVQKLVKEELEFLLYVLRIKQMIQPQCRQRRELGRQARA